MVKEYTLVKGDTKVLIVEDNNYDYELVERMLRKMSFSYEVRRAASGEEYEDLLYNYTPDLILSDFSIPSYSGLKALEFAKSVHPEVPFIFVSGSIGEERAVEALKQGADDYVLKDNLSKLEPSVKRALAEVKEKAKRKEAENKLKIKNKELRDLIYRISHDFKGPICTIQGATNLSKVANKREEHLLYANAIEKVIGKLDGIIKNLSNFQYVFADELNLRLFDLKSVVEEAINSVTLSLPDEMKQIELNMTLQGEPEAFSEKNFLYSVLYNLIHNAVVFSDENKTFRTIDCRVLNSDKGIEINVEDNGTGFDDKVMGRVCEMFYRGSVASKGAGLGLYIVKTCTDLLNGRLEIKSIEGIGTTVSLFFPYPNLEDEND
jgi:signal transduction histidine kinase